MSTEPTAIRRAWGKAHKPQGFGTACGRLTPVEVDRAERVPLVWTAPRDRCKTCWKESK